MTVWDKFARRHRWMMWACIAIAGMTAAMFFGNAIAGRWLLMSLNAVGLFLSGYAIALNHVGIERCQEYKRLYG